MQVAAALLRQYATAASQHVMRNNFITSLDAEAYDHAVLEAWSRVLGTELPPESVFARLPVRYGGTGITNAQSRRHTAIWTAWRGALDDIVSVCNFSGVRSFV